MSNVARSVSLRSGVLIWRWEEVLMEEGVRLEAASMEAKSLEEVSMGVRLLVKVRVVKEEVVVEVDTIAGPAARLEDYECG